MTWIPDRGLRRRYRECRARAAYDNTVARDVDPALIEYVTSHGDQDWLRLRVFPVVPGSPATIRLGLGVEHTTDVAIDPIPGGGAARISVDDTAVVRTDLDYRLVLAVPAPTQPRVASRPRFVRDGTSLVAGPTVVVNSQPCPEGRVCLRLATRTPVAKRVPMKKPRTMHTRTSTHRMRLRPTRWKP